MGVKVGEDGLGERAAFMRESLQKSQSITGRMVSILGSFDNRLSALEAAVRPTQIKTHYIRKAHENIDKTMKSAEAILSQFDLFAQAEVKVLRGPHEDLESYLGAIHQLRKSVQYFSRKRNFKSGDSLLAQANNLLAQAIVSLEEEFENLLQSYSKPVEPDRLFEGLPNSMRPSSPSLGNRVSAKNGSSEHNGRTKHGDLDGVYTLPTLIPPRILPVLHKIAEEMVQAGCHQQLLKIYRDVRSSVLEESLRRLGVEKLGRDDVDKMQWEVLEAKIGNWIHYTRIAVKLLFAAEEKGCEQIFESLDSLARQCFADATRSSVELLLSFGDAVSGSKRSPEKLFVLLDMYEILRELRPETDDMFRGSPCGGIRDSVGALTRKIADTARETFGDFEEAVEKDATKTALLDGTVHPLTSYVINYVKFLFDYQATLKQLFEEYTPGSELASLTARIMKALQTNLVSKSKQYRDAALTHLFLMNNVHYIVRSVRRSEAKDLLGDDWVQRYRRIVQQHANQYRRVTWSKILQSLSAQGLGSSGGSGAAGSLDGSGSSGVSRGQLKERFKSFNAQFEELHQRQSRWTVPDAELRDNLRLAVAEVLLPAYRSFTDRYGPMVEAGKGTPRHVRYTADDLERMLGELFEGKP